MLKSSCYSIFNFLDEERMMKKDKNKENELEIATEINKLINENYINSKTSKQITSYG